ncbi:subclass B3 metallo-beta-lactamase [Sphingomonas olei]|uniref:Subclass B3 metallo-beta-lactamase n=1 Tax=Sphingomonas olei TaxID=1886787 RepID=A0ABY2QFU9_9SPHN|nr:subclass B3 metallo-beta-lactamase [Sphingomonas olei]THG39455.1 subclass B3 metallo-beta-lactamase [Sphingomonas olei]
MVCRTGIVVAALLIGGSAAGPVVATGPGTAAGQQASDPLTRPLAVERESTWLAPRAPEKIFGTTYLVGFGGLSVALIDTGAGLILVDGALPQAAPRILDNVRKLGFKPGDIKYILSTEPHFDHAGGLAALVRDTGATVVASDRAAEGLRTGRLGKDDPQLAYDHSFPPVAKVRTLADGERLTLGKVTVTGHRTAGHTTGSMSWSWPACEGATCRTIVFASSLNPVSAEGYRYSAPTSAGIRDAFAQTYATMKAMPCDILITAHADQGGATGRYLTEPGACRALAEASERALAARLRKEAAGTAE